MRESQDEKYMWEAIRQARKAALLGETPIGCVIVRTRHVGPEDFPKKAQGAENPETGAEAAKKAENITSAADDRSGSGEACTVGDPLASDDVPFEECIIARGYNRRNTEKSALAHAELKAIAKAAKVVGDWRLEGCTMYVTLEPCQMCAGAIVQARLDRVVIGAMSPKSGCAGSVLNLLQEPRFNHQVEIESGVLGAECAALLTRFFDRMRGKKA